MFPKSGSWLPKTPVMPTEAALATTIGVALRGELGTSRRASKTIMAWTGVSDRTARTWLQGRGCPSGLHLLTLSATCPSVLKAFLTLAGHEDVDLALKLMAVEVALENALASVKSLR